MKNIQNQLKKQTPSIKFLMVLHSDMRYESVDDCEIIVEDNMTPGLDLQEKIFESLKIY